MILASLRDLAIREEIVSEPAFESKGVAWVIHIDGAGHFHSLESTLSDPAADEKGRKSRPQPKIMSIPRRCGRTVNIDADFLIDKAEYVLGTVPEGSPARRKPEKTELRRIAFLDLTLRAAEGTNSPLLRAVAAFLQSEEERTKCVAELNKNKWASNDLFTFLCEQEPLAFDPQIRQWWSSQSKDAAESENTLRQCVVCGERRVPVENHDSLKIPGGVTSGVPLVSFNSAAFEKYGLSRNENAPV
jgi:CRISPR-associated protein Csd1